MNNTDNDIQLTRAIRQYIRTGDRLSLDNHLTSTINDTFHRRLDAVIGQQRRFVSIDRRRRMPSARSLALRIANTPHFHRFVDNMVHRVVAAAHRHVEDEAETFEIITIDDNDDSSSTDDEHSNRLPRVSHIRRALQTMNNIDLTINARQSALFLLLQMPASSLVQSQPLADTNLFALISEEQLADGALMLIAKMFNVDASSPSAIVTDAFCATVMLIDRVSTDRLIGDDIVLKLYRLWHRMLVACTQLWTRFAADNITQMIDATFRLFSSYDPLSDCDPSIQQYECRNIAAALSVLDPSAEWLKCWLKSGNYRQLIIHAIDQYRYGDRLKQLIELNDSTTIGFYIYPADIVNRLLHNYHLCIALALFAYRDSRNCIFGIDSIKWLASIIERYFVQPEDYRLLSVSTIDTFIQLSSYRTCGAILLDNTVQLQLINAANSNKQMKRVVLQMFSEAIENVDQLFDISTSQLIQFINTCLHIDINASIRLLAQLIRSINHINIIIDIHHLSYDLITDFDSLYMVAIGMQTIDQLPTHIYNTFIESNRSSSIQQSIDIDSTIIDLIIQQMTQSIDNYDMVQPKRYVQLEYLQNNDDEYLNVYRPNTLIIIALWQTDSTFIINAKMQDFLHKQFDRLVTEPDADSTIMFLSIVHFMTLNLDLRHYIRNIMNNLLSEKETADQQISPLCAQTMMLLRINARLTTIAGTHNEYDISSSHLDNNRISSPIFVQLTKTETNVDYCIESLIRGVSFTDIIQTFLQSFDYVNNQESCTNRITVIDYDFTPILDYGIRLKIIVDRELSRLHLEQIMNKLSNAEDSNDKSIDWFIVCIYLSTNADFDQTLAICQQLTSLPHCGCIWPHFVGRHQFVRDQSQQVFPRVLNAFLSDLRRNRLRFALESAGIPLLHLLLIWSNQQYLNIILDWSQLRIALLLRIVGGWQMSADLFVQLIDSMHDDILLHAQQHDLPVYLLGGIDDMKYFKFDLKQNDIKSETGLLS